VGLGGGVLSRSVAAGDFTGTAAVNGNGNSISGRCCVICCCLRLLVVPYDFGE
jgi:hypothetical protein